MKMSKHPNWIQKLRFLLPKELRESPFGDIPKLPIDQLESILQKHLHAPKTRLEVAAISTMDLQTVYNDLGPEPFVQAIHVEPVKAPIFLLFKAQDVEKGHLFLTKGKLPSSTDVFKGVVKFLALKGVAAIDELHLFKGLSMSLTSAFPQEGLFEVFDLTLEIPGLALSLRLIVPTKTLGKIKEYYRNHPLEKALPTTSIDLPLHLELGTIKLSKKEIQGLEKLDLVHLEGISTVVLDDEYPVHICYKNTPLLSAVLKESQLNQFMPLSTKPQEKFMSSRDDFDEKEFSDLEEDFSTPDGDENEMLDEGEEDLEPQKTPPRKEHAPKTVVLEQVGLDCKIELGSITVPYQTLADLNPQSVLKVELDPKKVYLTFQGQILRRGEIVEFDQQLFFKVLE
jgi:flagellar motor switch/type III secretory pathway protein FliN